MEFLDTHQHLIYRDRFGYDWTAEIEALAAGDFTLDEYSRLVADMGIAGTLFMEAGVNDEDYQAEARFVSSLVNKQGMLGQIASCRPEENEGFDAWLEECGDLHVAGFRRILHVMPDDLSQSDHFRANLKKIGRRKLPFDICVLARQLPIAIELVRACDGQQYVLNHCGVPDIAGGAFASWAAGMKELAGMPHVAVKLSGISAYCAPGTASVETMKPWVDHVLDCFGTERIVWGSDWPVVNLGSGLPEWIELTRRLIAGLSADEQAAIAMRNARAIYGV